MTEPRRSPRFALPAIALLLFGVMLVSVRDILVPLLVLPLVLLVLWPIRKRPDINRVLLASGLLTLVWFLYRYSTLLGPFFVAAIFAYLLAPVVAWLERRGARRGIAVLGAILPVVVILVGVLAITIPQVSDQATELIDRLPQFGQKLVGMLEGTRDRLLTIRFLTDDQRQWLRNLSPDQIGTVLQQNSDVILQRLWAWALSLLRQVWSIFGLLGYLVVTPVVVYYLLSDWKKLLVSVEGLIPPSHRARVVGFIERYDQSLGGFIRGQLIEATLVGIMTTLGLFVLGVPSALLLGVTAGVFNLIPYIGIVISAVPALIVALTMTNPVSGLWRVALVYGIVQFIDGSITGPRIVGDSAGLHPLWVMLALSVGGALMGFIGLILAIPLAILVKMLGEMAMTAYRNSAAYQATPEADN
ncbi:MAG: AI-2E family transporter [Gemmatimonadota bacterium]